MPPKANKQTGKNISKKETKHTKKTHKPEIADSDKERTDVSVSTVRNRILPRPGEQLLNLLKSPAVCAKEIHGVRVTDRVLEQLTPQEVRDLRTVFQIFDNNSDGYLGSSELWQALKTLRFNVSRTEAIRLVHDVHFGRKREVNFSEFLEIVIDRQGDARDPHCEIMKAFEMFDLGLCNEHEKRSKLPEVFMPGNVRDQVWVSRKIDRAWVDGLLDIQVQTQCQRVAIFTQSKY